MKVAVIGAGIAGLSAAYDLARAGYAVTVYEAAPFAGGLASGFRDARWEWPLERFYHHLFETDSAIQQLVQEIGFADRLFFRRPVTAQWWRGRSYPLDGVMPVLRFPGLPFPDRLRFGMVAAYLKYGTNDWRRLEQSTAAQWTQHWAGPRVYREIWRPLLEGKFGPYADDVNMAWLWARLKARSFKLGYFEGGFQAFCDALLARVRQLGATVHLETPIDALVPHEDGSWRVAAERSHAEPQEFDAVIATGSPTMLAKLAPQLPDDYLAGLRRLRSMGAVVLTVALKEQLLDTVYWLMPPKGEFPFLALVEHTNFISPERYGGDRLIYCGDYLEPSHEYFRLTKEELLERFIPALKKVNPRFEPSWVRDSWLHREPYAQPIVPVDHARSVPPLATPLAGLYWASMSQVYPWDRGTNFAVELGRRVAGEVVEYAARVRLQGGGVLARDT
jgi:protoporphyrinogen oxidase